MQSDNIITKQILKKYGLDNPEIILYLDGNNIFIRQFATQYGMIQNSESKDIGQVTFTMNYIQDIIQRYENPFNVNKLFYNIIFEKGRSSQHKQICPDYKQNRNNKFLGLDFNENDTSILDKKDSFIYNMEIIRDIFQTTQDKLNSVSVYYTEGDFQIRYLMEKYQNYFNKLNKSCIHIVFSTDSDFRQLLSEDINMNVVIYDIIKKKLQTSYNYKKIYSMNESKDQKFFLFKKILGGDQGDNIKGVKGCGEVTQEKIYEKCKKNLNIGMNSEEYQEQVIDSVKDGINDKKMTKQQEAVLCSKDTLIRNYKMINLINIQNVIDMINLNQITELDTFFKNYVENRKNNIKTKNGSLDFKILMESQKRKKLIQYDIVDYVDIYKFLKQVS